MSSRFLASTNVPAIVMAVALLAIIYTFCTMGLQGAMSPAKLAAAGENGSSDGEPADVTKRLDRVEHLMREMNDRLKAIEDRLPPPKQQ